MTSSPLAPFLHGGGVLVLDGGLATELERGGFDLDHPLWSARLLSERPEAITAVHRAYLEAGADCITSASYQATAFGFRRGGATAAEAIGLLWRSVELALVARDAFCSGVSASRGIGRRRPLVAASIGPYGAFRADGSEYTGAWVSFSCRDGSRLCDGTPFADAVRTVAAIPQVVAVGVNCTAPSHVEHLLRAAAAVTDKPNVAYPSCRTGPDHVRAVRAALS